MSVVLKIRRGSSLQWSSSTRVLQVGELGIDTTLNKVKAGNGSSLWSALPWLTITPDELTTQASSTLQDANDYTDTAVSGLGNSLDGAYVPISDVGNPEGVASLDENGKIPDSEIPDSIARDTEIITSYNDLTDKPSIALGAVKWTANHYLLPGGENTRYLAGDIVWDGGNIYVANYDNESLPTSSTLYWTNIGSGNRLNIDGRDIPNILWDNILEKPTIPSLTGYATETYVTTAVSNLVDSAPETLNTLNELAAAINDDASYASTITTALGNKLDSSGFTYASITIPVYTAIADLPAAADNHGRWAHVHGEGAMYFAHGGAWYRALSETDLYASVNSQSTSYTLATTDLGKMIEMSGGGTLTVTDSSSFPTGFTVDILQIGSSQVTVTGNGFTINATPGLKLRTQWSSATLIKRGLNSWVLLGDLSA
jgi:hypothetical protein